MILTVFIVSYIAGAECVMVLCVCVYSGFCPIPNVLEILKSNYDYWKGQCPDSPSYSEDEPETSS